MTKKPTARKRPSTHFEQVAVSTVEAIARGTATKAQPKRDVPNKPSARKADSSEHFHAVQFYDGPDALCRIVGSFIGEGLDQGGAATLVVTPDHAERMETCLRQRGIEVADLTRAGVLTFIDARETLNQFMVDGLPNPSAFRRTVGGLLTELRRCNGDRPIRAYGEMVDLLWKDGRETAAIRLETLWNQLARSYDFELLCGYSMGNFYKGSMIDEIKCQHTHVVPDDGGAAVLDPCFHPCFSGRRAGVTRRLERLTLRQGAGTR